LKVLRDHRQRHTCHDEKGDESSSEDCEPSMAAPE
jgi:hypothetical protein